MTPRSLLPVALVVALCACDGADRDRPAAGEKVPGTDGTGIGTDTAGTAAYDVRFLDTIVPHHDEAIEMARIATQKATDPDLREMARTMLREQEAAKAQLGGWRDAWYAGAANAHDMGLPGTSSMHMDMAKLRAATDEAFDRQFVEMMIPHHEGGVAMSRDAAAKAEHPELRAKAQEMADEQERELEELRRLQSKTASPR
jgi:uncharacterized protein (DUF305 family)